tara:strand:- start:3193 stop:3402 length:210 start_codon:yes stop_codon:yes gene_type:complete
MSKDSNPKIDSIKKKIEKLYENFGIEIDINYEENLDLIIEHYLKNPDELNKDIKKSNKNKSLIEDKDIL